MNKNWILLCSAVLCTFESLASMPLPTHACKALTLNEVAHRLVVRSGSGAPLWSVQAELNSESPASLSRDATKLAFGPRAQPSQIVIAAPGKRFTAAMPSPSAMLQLDGLEWLPGDRLKARWEARYSNIQFATLTGWPTAPVLALDGDVASGVIDCTILAEGGRRLCTEGLELAIGELPVATFDHSSVSSQPREWISQQFIPPGSTVQIPGSEKIEFKVLSVSDGLADLEISPDPTRKTTISVGSGSEFPYPSADGTVILRTDSVQPSGVNESFIAVGEGLLTFKSVLTLGPGTIGVIVGTEYEDSFVEVWQKVGAGYEKRSRTAMPRASEIRRLSVSQESVLAVRDVMGFYEVPFTLSHAGSVIKGLTFGAVVKRPSTLAGEKVLEWHCH
jgi:hypothetical protein